MKGALEKKVLRDLRRQWAQALAIALVLACGVAILLLAFGMAGALDNTRSTYYERNRFANVFAEARRAPLGLAEEIAAIDGVLLAEPRVTGSATLDIPGRDRIAVGQIISLPESGAPLLNRPLLRAGRLPDPGATDEVAVNQPFAEAHGFHPGDRLVANLNGRKRTLTITGTVLSPEFVYTIGPGTLVPDNEGFGILWMPAPAVSAAFGMTGAFNSVLVQLVAGQPEAPVIERLDLLLDRYGGLGAYGRDRQQSDAYVSSEIAALRSMAFVLPPIFFGISAFLVAMVLGRIIALERAEIGLLKAIGYTDIEVALHYLMLAALIGVGGVLTGWITGQLLARGMSRLYAEFFEFPYVVYAVSYPAFIVSGVVGLLTTLLGALRAVVAAMRLAPAVAMSPPAPPRFKRSLLDRLMVLMHLSQPTLMIARGLMRWPVRSAMSALGVALAVAILAAANSFPAAMNRIITVAFDLSNRQDAMLIFSQEVGESGLQAVRRLPGVLQAEPQQIAPVKLRNGPREKLVSIETRARGADLSRLVDGKGAVMEPPERGLVLSHYLADYLQLRAGDRVEVEFLSGKRGTYHLPVTGLVDQYFGLSAYMDRAALNRLFAQAPRLTAVNVTLDSAHSTAFHAALKDLPALSGSVMLTDSRRSFRDTISQNIGIMSTVYIVIGVLITFGVTYNSARIQLSERARELASLRILGFGKGEISYILMGETLALALLAQPVGWALGAAISYAATAGFDSDLYRIPLVLDRVVFAKASAVVLAAALVSVLIVRRRIDRFDLIAVMKTRE